MIDKGGGRGAAKTRVLLAGPDESRLTQYAYPAFAAAGYEVMAVVDTPAKLRDVAATGLMDLVVAEANLAPDPEQALAALSQVGLPLALVLPVAWAGQRERFGRELSLVAGFSAPVTWPHVATELARLGESGQSEPLDMADCDQMGRRCALPVDPLGEPGQPPAPTPRLESRSPDTTTSEVVSTRSQPPGAALGGPPRLRIGFYGARGGVGTSTAALQAALALAADREWRVALFDNRGRGDLHLMAGLRAFDPQNAIVHRGVTFFPGPPTEEAVEEFAGVVIDGGRRPGPFNADWVKISRPLGEDRVRRLVGLPSGDSDRPGLRTAPGSGDGETERRQANGGESGETGWDRLKGLISIEITD